MAALKTTRCLLYAVGGNFPRLPVAAPRRLRSSFLVRYGIADAPHDDRAIGIVWGKYDRQAVYRSSLPVNEADAASNAATALMEIKSRTVYVNIVFQRRRR